MTMKWSVLMVLIALIVNGHARGRVVRPGNAALSRQAMTEAELRARLPEIRENIRQTVRSMNRLSTALAFMPDSVKASLIRQQMGKYAEEIKLFFSLPQPVQEKIITRILARHPEAIELLEDNDGVMEELGFRSQDVSRIIRKSRSLMIRRG